MEPPPPTAPEPTPAWKRRLTRAALGAGLWFAAVMLLSATGWIKPHLDRVAVYRSHVTGYRICPATEIHDCRIRGGTARGRDRVIRIGTIVAQADCDGQELRSLEVCERERPVTDYGNPEQTRRNRECLLYGGVIDGELMTLTDPRDPHLPANAFELTCREGEMTGTFQDEGL